MQGTNGWLGRGWAAKTELGTVAELHIHKRLLRFLQAIRHPLLDRHQLFPNRKPGTSLRVSPMKLRPMSFINTYYFNFPHIFTAAAKQGEATKKNVSIGHKPDSFN